jgi:hypothetical protein
MGSLFVQCNIEEKKKGFYKIATCSSPPLDRSKAPALTWFYLKKTFLLRH